MGCVLRFLLAERQFFLATVAKGLLMGEHWDSVNNFKLTIKSVSQTYFICYLS